MANRRLMDWLIDAAVEVGGRYPEMSDKDALLSALVSGCREYMLANGEREDYWTERLMAVIRGARWAEVRYRRRRFICEIARGVPQGQ